MTTTSYSSQDKGNFGWAVLAFFFPVVGLILWLVWRNERPGDSRMSRNGFLAGLILDAVSVIALVALGGVAAMVAKQG